MADPQMLAELYQYVIQDELGLKALIEEDKNVGFINPEYGAFFIILDAENDPEAMTMIFPGFYNARNDAMSRQELLELCNAVNKNSKLAFLSVRDGDEGNIDASVGSILASPDTIPDETLLRAVIGRAMSACRHAAEKFIEAVVVQQQQG